MTPHDDQKRNRKVFFNLRPIDENTKLIEHIMPTGYILHWATVQMDKGILWELALIEEI